MNRHRLQVLKDFLLTAPIAERFNLSTWAGTCDKPWMGHQDLSCGTSACAIGFATTIPEFQQAGLRLIRLELIPSAAQPAYTKDGMTFRSFEAVSEFFEISPLQANWAFDPECYPNRGKNATANDVAEHIQDILDDKDIDLQQFED